MGNVKCVFVPKWVSKRVFDPTDARPLTQNWFNPIEAQNTRKDSPQIRLKTRPNFAIAHRLAI